jgi:hypothetical protein
MRTHLMVARIMFASVALTSAVAATPAISSISDNKSYVVRLTGDAEAASARAAGLGGDMDGSGLVRLTVYPDERRLCYDFKLANLATPLMAHIHRGPAIGSGPSVVTLFTGPGGELDGCIMWTEKRLAEIIAAPSKFYVDLATTEYPEGAVRGQLPG